MQRNQIFVLSLQKIMGGHKTGGTGAKTAAACTFELVVRHQ